MYFAIDHTLPQLRGSRLEAALCQLPAWRREEAVKFKFESGRAQCAASYLLLCRLLRTHYGIAAQPRFILGPHGKPELAPASLSPSGETEGGSPAVHFNLSHCNEAVAAAVSTQPVGIDIESRGRYSADVARYVCSAEELDFLAADPALTDLRFTQLWTRKEAAAKLIGTGLSDGESLKGLLATPRFILTTHTYDSCVCTIAQWNSSYRE